MKMTGKTYDFQAKYQTDEDDFAVGVSVFDDNDGILMNAQKMLLLVVIYLMNTILLRLYSLV